MLKHVMLVDDSLLVLKMLEKTLQKLDCQVSATARNGKDAVKLYQEHKPELVFMDITMPIKSGLEAAAEIMGLDPQARIIMLTAMGDAEIMARAREIGVRDFLQKPFDEQMIKDTLVKLIKEEQ